MKLMMILIGLSLEIMTHAQVSPQLFAIGSGVGDHRSKFYRIDDYSTSPHAVYLADAGIALFDLAFDPTIRQFFAVDYESNLYWINAATGSMAMIGSTGVQRLNALEFDHEGRLFAWGAGSSNLYALNTLTGTATSIGNTGYASGGDLAWDTSGFLYGSTGKELIGINPTNAQSILIGAFGLNGIFGLEIDPDGNLVAAAGAEDQGRADLYWVDKETARLTRIGAVAGAADFGVFGLAFSGSPGHPGLVPLMAYPAIEIVWNSKSNVWYQLQWANTIDSTEWFNSGDPRPGTGMAIRFFDAARDWPRRFYRVLALE